MRGITEDDLALARFYRWERERGSQVFLTQPFDGGKVRDWTWAQSWRRSSPPGCLSLCPELGTGRAGRRSFPATAPGGSWPIWPSGWPATSASRFILPSIRGPFVRFWSTARPRLASSAPRTRRRPPGAAFRPQSGAFASRPRPAATIPPGNRSELPTDPCQAARRVRAGELATIIYTSGTTGTPKGVMHRFSDFASFAAAGSEWLGLGAEERLLSYLPLAHIVERCACEALGLYLGFRIFFTEGSRPSSPTCSGRDPRFSLGARLLLKFQQGVFHKIPKQRLDKLLRIPLLNRVGQEAHPEAAWAQQRPLCGERSRATARRNPPVVP